MYIHIQELIDFYCLRVRYNNYIFYTWGACDKSCGKQDLIIKQLASDRIALKCPSVIKFRTLQ